MYVNYAKINVSTAFFQGKTERCMSFGSRYGRTYHHWYSGLDDHFSQLMCKRVCQYNAWVQKCCSNHYGRDCQGKEERKTRRKDAPLVRHLSHPAHRGLEKILCPLEAKCWFLEAINVKIVPRVALEDFGSFKSRFHPLEGRTPGHFMTICRLHLYL